MRKADISILLETRHFYFALTILVLKFWEKDNSSLTIP